MGKDSIMQEDFFIQFVLQKYPELPHDFHFSSTSFFGLQKKCFEAFQHLSLECKKVLGYSLQILSGKRSFERQKLIWNEKILGLRPIEDEKGQVFPINFFSSSHELIFTILRWSAFPSLSRHHWGSDLDILPDIPGPKRLILEDWTEGAYQDLHAFLEEKLRDFGFFRPYIKTKSEGIAPEPWHLSFKDIATQWENIITYDLVMKFLETPQAQNPPILLWKEIRPLMPSIFSKYFLLAP